MVDSICPGKTLSAETLKEVVKFMRLFEGYAFVLRGEGYASSSDVVVPQDLYESIKDWVSSFPEKCS